MSDSTPQVAAAEAAYESLRELAHTVRDTPSAELYALNRELLGIARLFPDILRKLSALALARSDDAVFDMPVPRRSAKAEVETAARRLIAASELVDAAETSIESASQWFGTFIWQHDQDAPTPHHARPAPEPEQTPAEPRRQSGPAGSPPHRPTSAPSGLGR